MAVTPEQGAMWTYPVPEMTDRETAFNLAGALLGRVHLSGRLDLLRPSQEELVEEALTVYRDLRRHLPTALPHWPLGLPAWRDGWVSLALEVDAIEAAGYVLVWRRDDEQETAELPVPWFGGTDQRAEVVFPAASAENGETSAAWDRTTNSLNVALQPWSAVLVRLTAAPGSRTAAGGHG
jgi:alpha-galactosidase